jgi:putative hydrolase of the HAD superfamily
MIKAVIFDYGQVIGSSPNTHTRQDIADAFGVSSNLIGEILKENIDQFRKGKLSENQLWQIISEKLNKPIPTNADDLWRRDFRKKLKISKRMINFVRFLKERNVKVAVLSNNIKPYVEIIRQAGGYDEFPIVVNSCDVGYSKPQPEIYQLVIDQLKTDPKNILFLDDKLENLTIAKQFGIKTLLITDPENQIVQIRKLI